MGDREQTMKTRIFPHVTKDKIRNEVRKDSATAQVDAIIFVL